VLSWDAVRLQNLIVWDSGDSRTVEVEIDCTVMAKWRLVAEAHLPAEIAALQAKAAVDPVQPVCPAEQTGEAAQMEQVGGAETSALAEATGDMSQPAHPVAALETLVYHYYVWIGARRRGDVRAMFMLPAAITHTVGEGRVPPESSELFHRFCDVAFGEGTGNLISMTDGCHTYRCRCARCAQRFVQREWVNHSRKPTPELSRSAQVIADVKTRALRPAMAGTMNIDGEWGFLKAKLPQNSSAKTEKSKKRLDREIRAAQWLRMCSTEDRWPRFCEAVRLWMAEHDKQPPVQVDLPIGRSVCATAESSVPSSTTKKDSGQLGQDHELESIMAQLLPGELEKLEEACRRQGAAKRAKARCWIPPEHPVAPLPQDVAPLPGPAPGWYNARDSEAISDQLVQVGATCGLHALNHLMASDAYLHGPQLVVLTQQTLESRALEANLGDAHHNLCQPGGSNYDFAVLSLNAAREGLSIFPMTPADLEGSPSRTSVAAGGRLVEPFADYLIKEGVHTCVGYLLRIPSAGGHWVSVVPGALVSEASSLQEAAPDALLCDSLHNLPFSLSGEQVEQLLQASALSAANAAVAEVAIDFACFLVGRKQ
jgi:hypothetical protein